MIYQSTNRRVETDSNIHKRQKSQAQSIQIRSFILHPSFSPKMGSIEVFDFKNKQWIPYVPDLRKWQRHFEDISQGRVRADHKGRYIVGSGARWRSPTASSDDLRVTMVTPIAQTIEMAKSELKSNYSKVIRGRKCMRYDDTIFKKDI